MTDNGVEQGVASSDLSMSILAACGEEEPVEEMEEEVEDAEEKVEEEVEE